MVASTDLICYNIAIFRDMRNTNIIFTAICNANKARLCILAPFAYVTKFCKNIHKLTGKSYGPGVA
jgi:hypothetical protein